MAKIALASDINDDTFDSRDELCSAKKRLRPESEKSFERLAY